MNLIVTIVRGPESGNQKEFAEPGRYIFGCDPDTHFRLSANDRFVSGRHFQIEIDPPHCFLQDLGGPNQPRVNGRPVSRHELHDQDEVQVGATRLRFSIVFGPICHWCRLPGLGLPTTAPSGLKDNEVRNRMVYAHEGCIPRDQHFGRMIGNYVCYRRLGGGGFGEVFLAYEPSTARVWAIKTAIQGQDEGGIKRFRREARLLLILQHPNIVHCVGSGVEPDGTTYLVSEYVSGGDLQSLIRAEGSLQLGRALQLMVALLDALVYLQSAPRPTEHRDIKPANVLLASGYDTNAAIVPRLADFGVAKAFGIITTPLTNKGDFIGTLGYVAPEIVQSGVAPDDGFQPGPDVYSLGATFYFMLTRSYPFDFPHAGGTPATLFHILHNDTIPVGNRESSIPRALAAVIDQACFKDPRKRYSNAAEFQKAFLSCVRH